MDTEYAQRSLTHNMLIEQPVQLCFSETCQAASFFVMLMTPCLLNEQ